MARVIKPGGVLYLDHELSPGYWTNSPEYEEYRRAVWRPYKKNPMRFFSFSYYLNRYRLWKDPRYQEEGDIHVWPDDHVEWDRIKDALISLGFEITAEKDYLLYREGTDAEIYRRYRSVCSDMRLMTARKNII